VGCDQQALVVAVGGGLVGDITCALSLIPFSLL